MHAFYREKEYSMIINVFNNISEDFSTVELRRNFFHLLTQPHIASIDQEKIYLQRFFKYKHKIAHIIYIFLQKWILK